jgi:uncharacterized protein
MKAKFEIRKTKEGEQWYFVLIAPNSKTIATSEMYDSKQSCEKGIDAVKEYAPDAEVEDKTKKILRIIIRKK